MGSTKTAKWVLLGIFVGLFIGIAVLGAYNQPIDQQISNMQSNSFDSLASTNPSSPTYLSDDSALYEYYSSSGYYYYRTSSSASSSYYHVVWYIGSSSDNLYLYSDSSYSSMIGSCSSGSLNWIVYRPSSSGYLYPRTYSNSGGYGYIEWEDSSYSLSIGYSESGSLSSSEYIEIYNVYLSSSSSYSFSLDVPSGGDFDLYLCRLSYGSWVCHSGFSTYSANSGSGYDELISSYRPSTTDYYAIIVKRTSGSGTYYLSASSGAATPSLTEESALYQSYSSYSSYYYQTGYADSGYYHVIWLQPTSSSYYDYLYLYSDSSYSTEIAWSAEGYGELSWVVVRPSGSQYYYPEVYSYSGGYAYIEWECAYTYLSVGDTSGSSLSSSECVETYVAYLSSSKRYTFTLNTPSGGDYDLYLYRLSYGDATSRSGYSACSTNYGSGDDESISNYDPSYTGDYLIMVVRSSGSGSFTISLEESVTISPGAIFLLVFGILATIGISAGVYKKYSRQRRPGQPQGPVQAPPQAVKPIPQKLESGKYIQKGSNYITCAYCQSKNDMTELFCNSCGSEL